ncbi:4-(cytidine 5'-diphospho)-2-C-methyl-D-erythritol kinase [Actibacterium pelagium]|uniref:4-diphosphocytidyl-2-C-methyl-D-erythritol kinase n=1 Tax=Actibacterium pelagium TaxID=2029103 RepID=A0A917AHU1_9RHOB|nr:4-(cytidine 5'-diphospho)-2-C-methyl-D-erythritol kinase [Actibacterium pelagium]GGE54099.1 4-diphosphocytidyl-2-C-methyl-D-erythritol kinase [Actibacterium pelagium]
MASRSNAVSVLAPAKVNLSLHVTGQRDDGYHLLDSLVAFAPVHDRLDISHGNTLSLTVEGPEGAGVPADMDNLVLKAAAMFADDRGAAITLTKNLPSASGIGGGSADAAAIVRGLMVFWGLAKDWDDPELADAVGQKLAALGADIPMCLLNRPARVSGIGDEIEYISPLGPIPAILINPRVEVSTPAVFRALKSKTNPPMPETLPAFKGVQDFVPWLTDQRNDLQEPALALAPEIGKVLNALEAEPDCMLARMSGSGATCFGIFPNKDSCYAATERLYTDHPDWWVAGGFLGDQFELSLPKVS